MPQKMRITNWWTHHHISHVHKRPKQWSHNLVKYAGSIAREIWSGHNTRHNTNALTGTKRHKSCQLHSAHWHLCRPVHNKHSMSYNNSSCAVNPQRIKCLNVSVNMMYKLANLTAKVNDGSKDLWDWHAHTQSQNGTVLLCRTHKQFLAGCQSFSSSTYPDCESQQSSCRQDVTCVIITICHMSMWNSVAHERLTR